MPQSPEGPSVVEGKDNEFLDDLTALIVLRDSMIEERLSGLPLELRLRTDARLSAIELTERALEQAGFGVGYWQTTIECAVDQTQHALSDAATVFKTPPDGDSQRAIAEIVTDATLGVRVHRASSAIQIAATRRSVVDREVTIRQGINDLSRQLAAPEPLQPVFSRAKEEAEVVGALAQTYGPDGAIKALSVSGSKPFGVEARALRAELFGLFAHEHATPQWSALPRQTKDKLVVLASLLDAPFCEKTQLLTRHPEFIFALSTLPRGVAEKLASWVPAVQAAEALCVEAVLAQKKADDITKAESWITQAAATAEVIAYDMKRVARGVRNATREVVSDPAGTLLRAGDDVVGFLTAMDQPANRRLLVATTRISSLALAILLPACATAPTATIPPTLGAPDGGTPAGGTTAIGPSAVDVFAAIPQFVSFLNEHGITPDCVVDQSFITAHADSISASLDLFKGVVEQGVPPGIIKADCVVQTGDPNIPIVFQLKGNDKIYAVDPSGQLQEAAWKDGQLIFVAEANQAFLAQGPEATPGASAYPASIDYNALRELVFGQGGALPEGFMENTEVQARIALRKAWLDQSGTPYVSVDVITWGSGDAFRWDVVGKDAQGNIVGWLQVKDSTMPGGWRFADGPSWDSSPTFNPQTDIYGFALPQKLNETNRFVVVSIVKPGEEGRILVEVDAAGNPVRWLSATTQTWETPAGTPIPTEPSPTPETPVVRVWDGPIIDVTGWGSGYFTEGAYKREVYDWLPNLAITGSGPFTLVAIQEQNGIITATFARTRGSITTRFTVKNVVCDVAGAGANPRPSQLGNLGELTLGGSYNQVGILFAEQLPIISQLPLSPKKCTDVLAGLQPNPRFLDEFDAYLRTGTIPPEWTVTSGAVDLTKMAVLTQALKATP